MKRNNHLRNVAILATDSSAAKAYITSLHRHGFTVGRVLYLNRDVKKSAKNRISSFGKMIFSKIFLQNILNRIRYQFRSKTTLPAAEKNVIRELNSYLRENNIFSTDLTQPTKHILDNINWSYYEINVININDNNLITFLEFNVEEKYLIFTGGGILRNKILSLDKRFIHIHPGIVPKVKGSDCFLWSVLLYKSIGMSGFFMNEGIDTGDIIIQEEYPLPNFKMELSLISSSGLKNILINYCDPHYRAETLIRMFINNHDPSLWTVKKQVQGEGRQYYSMHDRLILDVKNQLFYH